MNICVINEFLATPERSGAGHMRHYSLAKSFIKRGHNVTFVTGSQSHLTKRNKIDDSRRFNEKIEDGIRIISIRTPRYNKSRSILRIISMFVFAFKAMLISKKRLGRVNIILVSSPSLVPVLTGLFYKIRIPSAKFIIEIRDIWPKSAQELGNFSEWHPFIFLLKGIEYLGYRYADHIVSVLTGADAHIKSVVKKKIKFTWIPNGVDIVYKREDVEQEVLDKVHDDTFNVIYMGTLGIANAMEYYIEAARILRGGNNNKIKFYLVGEGGAKRDLELLAKGLDNVVFINQIEKSKVNSLLKKFDLGYLASKNLELYRYGISANKIYDYMLAGVPIIMSTNFPHREIENAGCGWLLKAENAEEIAACVEKISKMDIAEIKQRGANGFNYVMKHNTYEVLAGKYLEVFEDCK